MGEPLPMPPTRTQDDRVTFHLDNVDVRQALEMIGRTHRVNILVAPEVDGLVTANFDNVPLDSAINGILKLCNLTANMEDDLIFVYAADGLPKSDLQVQVFSLYYSSAEESLPAVQGLLSDVGQAFVSQIDDMDNRRTKEAIVVVDTPAFLARVEQYIAQTDHPPRQVMIEAHVLEVKLSDNLRHGVNLTYLLSKEVRLDLIGMANPTASPALFAEIDGHDVDALVECLQTTVGAKTLASPRVMVVNGQRARIQVGQQLGFKVVTVTETAAIESVTFLDVGVVLEVTPQVTPENRVLMHVKPKVSSGRVDADTQLPEEETRELETNVLLMDGQGVVIGGLIQEKNEDTRKKVPLLGDAYLIGRIFQRQELVQERSEIVITLVPRIVELGQCGTLPDVVDTERRQTPLLEEELYRTSRSWEPAMRNPIYSPRRILPR